VFGLNSNGFKRKEYNDIVESLRTRAKDTFGDDFKIGNDSFTGMFITVIAWSISLIWALAEKVFYSRFVEYAEDNGLTISARNAGTERRGAEFATAQATFDGIGIVPVDTVISANDLTFRTVAEGTTGVPQTVKCDTVGIVGNVPIGATWTIVTAPANITGVSVGEATGGRNAETDAELRTRHFLSLGGSGAATLDAITSELLRTDGVRGAIVNNIKDSGFVVGINAVVLGGTPSDIAKAILSKVARGVKMFGAQTENATALNGQVVPIKFDFAEEVPIYVNVTLTKGVAYPVDGDSRVKRVIAQYIGGTDAESNLYAGISLGETVVYSKLVSEIFKVDGVEDAVVEISSDNITFVKANILIASNKVAETSADKVVLT